MPTGIMHLITSLCLSAHLLSRNIVLTYFPDYHEALLLLVKPYTPVQKTSQSEEKKVWNKRVFSLLLTICLRASCEKLAVPPVRAAITIGSHQKGAAWTLPTSYGNLGCHKKSRRSGLAPVNRRYRKYHCWLSRQLFLLNQQSLYHCSAKAHDTFRKKKNT